MTHTEYDGLSVLLVGTMLAGDCIAARTVFWTVKRHTVDGDSKMASRPMHDKDTGTLMVDLNDL